MKDRLGIMHLHQQKISILKITPAGHFEPVTTIGYVLRPDDLNLLLETHPEYRKEVWIYFLCEKIRKYSYKKPKKGR